MTVSNPLRSLETLADASIPTTPQLQPKATSNANEGEKNTRIRKPTAEIKPTSSSFVTS